ncbi:MAG TPA: hypothetical protein VM032_03180 [Vicinamibacterales bacterium]|nr:hypothetical protein [Vicinamibacterales bacterium]
MAEQSKSDNPFAALIAASWIIVAVLYVAGFSYRWSYYYNFGVQHLVLQQSVQSFLVAALELVRQPQSAALTLLYVIVPLVLLNVVIAALAHLAGRSPRRGPRRLGDAVMDSFSGGSPFVRDALRAIVLLYGCFAVSSEIGADAFRRDVVDSAFNPLPRVTLVSPRAADASPAPLACGSTDLQHVNVIGDATGLAGVQDSLLTCNSPTRTWRLLYRDDKFVYVFASQPAEILEGARPLTLVIPNDSGTFLVTQ